MRPWHELFPWTHRVLRLVWPERSARRQRYVVLAAIVLGLLAVHAALTAYVGRRVAVLADGLAAQYGPLVAGTLAPPPVRDADNAARAVRAAVEMLGPDHKTLSAMFPFATFEKNGGPDSESASRAQELVAANATALALLDAAAARPAANWGLNYSRGLEIDLPPLLPILDLAKLNVAAGRLALRDGRVDAALVAVSRGGAIERSLVQEAPLIVQLVRAAVGRVTAGLVREMIASDRLDAVALDRLTDSLPAPTARETFHRSLVGETKAIHDSIARLFVLQLYSGEASSDSRPAMPNLVSWLVRPVLLDNDRAWLEHMGRVIAWQQTPRQEREGRFPEIQPRAWHLVLKLVLPNLVGVVDRADFAEAREAMTRLAVAIERYRAAEGAPPDSLDALAPRFVSSVPKDPFGGGAPFAYTRTGDGWRLVAGEGWRNLDSAQLLHDPVLEWGRAGGASGTSSRVVTTPVR